MLNDYGRGGESRFWMVGREGGRQRGRARRGNHEVGGQTHSGKNTRSATYMTFLVLELRDTRTRTLAEIRGGEEGGRDRGRRRETRGERG